MDFMEFLNKIDPSNSVLTESAKKELVAMMDQRIASLKEESYMKAKREYEQKTEKLTEEHTKKMQDIYTKTKSLYENKIQKIDDEASRLMEDLYNKVDKVASEKLMEYAKLVDKNHTDKMIKLSESYKKQIKLVESKKTVDEKLVEGVSKYLDTYLEEQIPTKQLINEAKLNRLEKMFNQIKEITFINDDYVQTEIKEAILDANQIIKSKEDAVKVKETEIDRLMMEKVELKHQIEKIEASNLLSEKTKDMTPSMKAYVETVFKNADKKEIEERLNEAVNAFRTEEEAKKQQLLAESEKNRKVKAPVILTEEVEKKVEQEKQQMLTESHTSGDAMEQYVDVLKRADRKNSQWRK